MTADDNKPPVIDFNEAKKRVQERRKDDATPAYKELAEKESGTQIEDYGFHEAWARAQPMIKEAARKNFNEHVVYYIALALILTLHAGIFTAAMMVRIP